MQAEVNVTKARYHADPERYRVRLQCQLRTRGMTLAECDEGMALIVWANKLAHPTPADTRADVACDTAHAVRFRNSLIYGLARKTRLEKFATSGMF